MNASTTSLAHSGTRRQTNYEKRASPTEGSAGENDPMDDGRDEAPESSDRGGRAPSLADGPPTREKALGH